MEKCLISVNRFTESSQTYFLTHLHTDHTQGLTLKWGKCPLFCSKLTAKLLPFKFPDFNLSLLRVVDLHIWHSFSLISLTTRSQITTHVMALDAHHCLGKPFFYEVDSERAKDERNRLLNVLKNETIDVIDIIASHPEHDIVIGIDTSGKEELLIHISHMLNIKVRSSLMFDGSFCSSICVDYKGCVFIKHRTKFLAQFVLALVSFPSLKIWVWPKRLQTMHLLGFHDTFTTKTSLTRVRAVPRYSFSIETLEGFNTMRPTIGIMPSSLSWVLKPV
ncbi:hypothetical protein POTOM_044551 [Populus tomentosa]|uniref:DNA repair metallo-beta-lactamase domain-containing protein n=1 Tax=Populus tomentosa TaxID=118781 RepID=A0A8X7YNJ7_POPTO|nr:hypothetical protein POTOM_044551 [Populus tomentosa]